MKDDTWLSILWYMMLFIPVILYITPILIYRHRQVKKGTMTKVKKIVITILLCFTPVFFIVNNLFWLFVGMITRFGFF